MCLSRACLGTMIVFSTKMAQRRRFPHHQRVSEAPSLGLVAEILGRKVGGVHMIERVVNKPRLLGLCVIANERHRLVHVAHLRRNAFPLYSPSVCPQPVLVNDSFCAQTRIQFNRLDVRTESLFRSVGCSRIVKSRMRGSGGRSTDL